MLTLSELENQYFGDGNAHVTEITNPVEIHNYLNCDSAASWANGPIGSEEDGYSGWTLLFQTSPTRKGGKSFVGVCRDTLIQK